MNDHRDSPLTADEHGNRKETASTVGTNSDSENEAANHQPNGDHYPLVNEAPNGSDQHEEKKLANQSFFMHFLKSNGPPQVIIICLVYALAIGCIVGVVSDESVCFESSKCRHVITDVAFVSDLCVYPGASFGDRSLRPSQSWI
jgi:hypothetical protein